MLETGPWGIMVTFEVLVGLPRVGPCESWNLFNGEEVTDLASCDWTE